MEGRGIEQKKKKGLMDMDNSVVTAGGGGIRGLNDNGKNTIKMRFTKRGCGEFKYRDMHRKNVM